MPRIRRPLFALTLTALIAAGTVARGAELLGKIKSVDAGSNKIVITPDEGGGDAIELSVKDTTSWINAKGKTPKKFDLSKVKKGTQVEVTYEDSTASRVVIKQKPAKKKKAAKAE